MISNHIYMNKKEGSAFENNDLSNLAPEYIKTDGDYDLFIISLFLSILFLIVLIIWFIFFR
jgi:hypothetical protein